MSREALRRERDSNALDLGREESRNNSNQAGSWDARAALRDETKREEPELLDADSALKVAIKAAVDAGQWQRAEALMAIARERRVSHDVDVDGRFGRTS